MAAKQLPPPPFFTQSPTPLWPGEQFSLGIRSSLLETTTPFQSIHIFDSTHHGRVLVLDGIIQLTERDEANYHEMLILPALCLHASPRRIAIIGGGDGGATTQALRMPQVESIVQVEIDAQVVQACREHLGHLTRAFDDPRVDLRIGDGVKFLETSSERFDVLYVDSSDPFSGPNCGLFTDSFYATCRERLAPRGVLVFQAESALVNLALVAHLYSACKALFPVVRYYSTQVPTYPGGDIGFLLCSLDSDLVPACPVRLGPANCAYYSAPVHAAAFALPARAQRALDAY